jgi:hypothetical protein
MVRNEANLVEAFVRHNLTQLDPLTVVDHASADGTSEILAALVAEGLPLALERDDTLAQRQPEVLTRTAHSALAAGADIVVPLDADEFPRVPARTTFERVVDGHPDDVDGLLPWQTCVPDRDDDAPLENPLAHPLGRARRRLAIERHGSTIRCRSRPRCGTPTWRTPTPSRASTCYGAR